MELTFTTAAATAAVHTFKLLSGCLLCTCNPKLWSD